MRVFVLTETDSTDPTWCYSEVFDTLEKAKERMHQLYKENVVDRYELVCNSTFGDMSASGEMVDGITLAWNIKDCDVM